MTVSHVLRGWNAILSALGLLVMVGDAPDAQRGASALTPHRIALASGKRFSLNTPEGFEISIAAQGLKRVRFLARSPDERLFVTDMYNRADNRRGAVYILEGFDPAGGTVARVVPYLTRLRNPNSIVFHTDRSGTHWLYVALTDRLVRYRYSSGDNAPKTQPQVLATFPDYGLSYKYGGWHLTRTVIIGPDDRVYVAVGSSCNACEEKEDVRASVIEMDLDGANQRVYATGLRNGVGLRWVGDRLFATNMGADHLGDDRPEDALYVVTQGASFGWPFCYPFRGRVLADARFSRTTGNRGCAAVKAPVASFPAHSSPLGLEYFAAPADSRLENAFLVALHGSSKLALNHGYRIVRVVDGGAPEDFVTGLQEGRVIHGRPADILRVGRDAFLFTDDHAGVIYYVRPQRGGRNQ